MKIFAAQDGITRPYFTQSFENVVFVIAPSCIFLILVPSRIFWLTRQRRAATSTVLLQSKIVLNLIYLTTQLCLLIIQLGTRHDSNGISVSANTLRLSSAIAICILSGFEQVMSPKRSLILGTYLLLTALTDAVQVRTLWLLNDTLMASLLTSSLAVKLMMIVLEETDKLTPESRSNSNFVPGELSGIYGKSLFWWVNGFLRQGYSKTFRSSDLFKPEGTMAASHLVPDFDVHEDSSTKKSKKLVLVLLDLVKWQLLPTILARMLVVVLNICQPLLMEGLLDYLQKKSEAKTVGYGFLVAFALVYIGIAMFNGIYYRKVYYCTTMIRGYLTAKIYNSTLHGRCSTEDDSSAITLISADVQRVCSSTRFIHEFWAEPLQVGLAAWLLKKRVGSSFVVPIVITLLTTIAVSHASRWAQPFQKRWMSAIQSRTRESSAVLTCMEALKMTGLTQSSTMALERLREAEVQAGKSFRQLEALTSTSAYIPALLSPPITFAIFVATSSKGYSVSTVLTSLSLLQLITQPLSSLLQAVVPLVGASSCLRRIESYLLIGTDTEKSYTGGDLKDDKTLSQVSECPRESILMRSNGHLKRGSRGESSHASIRFDNVSIGWASSQTVFSRLTVNFPVGSTIFILGPIASGKSTLLKAIIGSIKPREGTIDCPWSKFGYCEQQPWIRNTTIRKNIVEYSDWDPRWYATVLHATCLDEDIERMDQGDQTSVGDSGTALSGGQRKRVALARAIYSRHRALVLDDPLAGLDSGTQSKICLRVFGSSGLFSSCTEMTIMTTNSLTPISPEDHVILLGSDGHLRAQGLCKDLEILRQEFCSAENLNADSAVQRQEQASLDSDTGPVQIARSNAKDAAVFLYYLRSVGSFSLMLFLMLAALFAFLSVFPAVVLQWWAEAESQAGLYLGVYAGLQVAAVVVILSLCSLTLVHMVAKSGLQLHNVILKAFMSSSWSSFVAIGSADILNRLTHDLGIIDAELPELLLDLICGGSISMRTLYQLRNNSVKLVVFTLVGQAILIARSSWFIAAAYVPLIILLWTIQRFYLRTSKQLRHLELEAKEPVYRQLTESLAGLATIRTFGWQKEFISTNNDLIDQSQQPYYLLLMVQRWLSLVLDLVTAGVAVLVVGVAVALRERDSTDSVGIALLNIMSFATYTRLVVVLWSATETALGAVSRIMVFEQNMDSETDVVLNAMITDPQDCLIAGSIVFDNVCASYSCSSKPTEKMALRNISLMISPGQRVGICGHSGCGKSSLVKSLLGMLNITTGSIHINDINIKTILPNTLRASVTTVTQDPWFLPGSIAANLDTAGSASSEQIVRVLKRVNLWHIFEALDLTDQMDQSLLSQGQKQLFCLARAIIAPKGVVILDEYTSAVDRETEIRMQEIAEEAFTGCTVVAIAHHLETMMSYDTVVVMDRGKIAEIGKPMVLLQESSRLRDMYFKSSR